MTTIGNCNLEPIDSLARACARDKNVHVGFFIGSDCDSATSRTVFSKQTPAESYVASTTCIDDYCRNQQYSITAITTSSGAITERYAYTAYGLPTILEASASVLSFSAISNRYTYTGREWDETLALHHFRARWMSPVAGRFLGRDPIGYDGSQWNVFEHMASGPIGKIDPMGLRVAMPGRVLPPIRPYFRPRKWPNRDIRSPWIDPGRPEWNHPSIPGYDPFTPIDPFPFPDPVPPVRPWRPTPTKPEISDPEFDPIECRKFRFRNDKDCLSALSGCKTRVSQAFRECIVNSSPEDCEIIAQVGFDDCEETYDCYPHLPKPKRKRDCKKATQYHLNNASIENEHAFKTAWDAVPWSDYDICACRDGSIVIARTGKCGTSDPSIPTDARWK